MNIRCLNGLSEKMKRGLWRRSTRLMDTGKGSYALQDAPPWCV